MLGIKLQLGCLLIILALIIRYNRLSKHLGIERSPLFLKLQGIAVAELLFDAATAYTVNHPNLVPSWMNGILHWAFLVMLNLLVFCAYFYITSILHEDYLQRTKKRIANWLFLVSSIAITITMPLLYYVQAEATSYSMGVPVYICFSMISIILLLSIIEIRSSRTDMSGFQLATCLMMVCSIGFVALLQALFPQTLISCMVPVLIIFSATSNMEDPYTHYLLKEGEQMRRRILEVNTQLHASQVMASTDRNNAKSAILTIKSAATRDVDLCLPISDFMFAVAEGNYITISFEKDGVQSRTQLRQTMKQLEIILSQYPRIMRVHRAFFVNLDRIEHIEGNSLGYKLSIRNCRDEIPVSRSYISAFNEQLGFQQINAV